MRERMIMPPTNLGKFGPICMQEQRQLGSSESVACPLRIWEEKEIRPLFIEKVLEKVEGYCLLQEE